MSEQMLKLILDKLDNVDGRFDRMDAKFDQIDARFDRVENRLDKIESVQQSHGDHIQQLIKIVSVTNAKLSETNARVDTIEQKLDHLTADVEILKENQQTVISMQQDHQKILERLAIRSVAHEADIAELLRIK